MLAFKIALSQLKSNCYKPQTHPRKSKFVRTLVVNVKRECSHVLRNGINRKSGNRRRKQLGINDLPSNVNSVLAQTLFATT